MKNAFKTGAEWRRWDLHLHTKNTYKSDEFTSTDFNSFCDTLFEKALAKEISAIGITDYFNINNYKKVLHYLTELDTNEKFKQEERDKIKNILIIPNVELRVLPVTDSGRMVNFHCLFNPDYVENLDDDFFNTIHMSIGTEEYHMNESGLKKLGLSKGATEETAFKKGIESFVVSPGDLVNLFKKKPTLRKNTVTVVSNSNKDGNSAYQKHYDFFEEVDKESLEQIRKSIYHLSDFIFSSNKNDKEYFLGKKRNADGKIIDDDKIVKIKCGSLKGCIHGSDAHTEEKLFMPDNNMFCWVKADPTFDGLQQVLIEPEERLFIGELPPIRSRVLDNRTKYIKGITISAIADYDGKHGKWFENVDIELNKELVAIIGNKGSGKSALADIISLCAFYKNQTDFSFLTSDKFRNGNVSKYFKAVLEWESGIKTPKLLSDNTNGGEIEQVKYLPQGYFEKLTNEINTTEAFQQEIQDVVFTHLDNEGKLGFDSFEDLIEYHKANVEREIQSIIVDLNNTNSQIIKLEHKLNPLYKKETANKLKQKLDELNALVEPIVVKNPAEDAGVSEQNRLILVEIERLATEAIKIEEEKSRFQQEKDLLLLDLRDLKELKQEIDFKVGEITSFKEQKKVVVLKHQLDIDVLISASSDVSSLTGLITTKDQRLKEIKQILGEEPSLLKDFKSIKIRLEELDRQIAIEQNKLDATQKIYQIYLSDKKGWEEKRNKIIGTDNTPETIKFYEREISYLENSLNEEIERLRVQRTDLAEAIFDKKQEVIQVYKQVKGKLDVIIEENEALLNSYKINIEAKLSLNPNYSDTFFRNINQNQSGTFYTIEGGGVQYNKLIKEIDFDNKENVKSFLNSVVNSLFEDQRENYDNQKRYLEGQIKNPLELYNSLFSLSFLDYNYQLMQGAKKLQQLSPGERGALLLIFYLLLDNNDIPLIIDQPEDNLDNHSVANILVPFIRKAKAKRQIILVTHNPNLAVVSDAEQIIFVNIDKEKDYEFEYNSGSIENRTINDSIVKVLEGAMPAFNKRKQKYYE